MAALKTPLLHPGMRIGLYGGSFDPVHDAHLHVARTALRRLNLDRLWWLVSPGNPLKPHPPASLQSRIKAINAAIAEPRHVISDLETRLNTRRTIDLIRHLQTKHAGVRFVWIMGADGLAQFHNWKNWGEIAARVPICVVSRPGSALKARLGPAARRMKHRRMSETSPGNLLKGHSQGWTYLTEPLHPHASRVLRARIRPVT